MTQKPQILTRTLVAQSRLFRIEQLELKFSNGEQRQYERLMGSGRGGVLIVPLLDAERFCLVREYAAGLENYELGFPKGMIDPGEDALTAANRELMEEIGYVSHQLTEITTLTVAPGYLQHRLHVILAEDLYPKRLPGDEPEPLEVVPWRWDDLEQLLQRSDFSEARSIAALFLIRERLRGLATTQR